MNCESVKKKLSLYLYGELSFEEEEQFAEHLDGCETCRQELEHERRIHRALDGAALEPPAELLARCREELAGVIRPAQRPQGAWIRWRRRLRMFAASPGWLSPAWLRPAGAVLLVAIGFFGGRFTAMAPSPLVFSPAEPVAARVRYVEPSGPGRVRIVVDETRQRVLTGRLDDRHVQELLLAAVREPSDPGVRGESVDLLKMRTESREVRDALLYAVENDPNDGVRLKALDGLRPYARDPKSRKVLSRVLLNDRNPGVRAAAIDLLIQSDTDDVVETLQELMQTEDNNYIRLRGQNALRAMNASVESF